MTLSPAARSTDPITSHLASEEHTASGKRACHIAIVIDAVRRHPGMTSAELAPICKLERHEVARRTADAEKCGAIRKGEIRKCDIGGRCAVTWWPAEGSEA